MADEYILCCQDGDIPIYKVNLRFLNADQTDYNDVLRNQILPFVTALGE